MSEQPAAEAILTERRDGVLIMTIKAGFGGQRFMPELLEKVRRARRYAESGHLQLCVEVDGGIDEVSIEQAAQAGADAFVAGTAVYGAGDPAEAVRRLRAAAERVLNRPGEPAAGVPADPGEPTAGVPADPGEHEHGRNPR